MVNKFSAVVLLYVNHIMDKQLCRFVKEVHLLKVPFEKDANHLARRYTSQHNFNNLRKTVANLNNITSKHYPPS